jgi:hypothetical protein
MNGVPRTMIMPFSSGKPPDVITNDLFDYPSSWMISSVRSRLDCQESISIIDNRSTDIHDTSPTRTYNFPPKSIYFVKTYRPVGYHTTLGMSPEYMGANS